MSDPGIYCLVFSNPACTLTIGKAGERFFQAGWHVYVGSALGSGGLSRVSRHVRLNRERYRGPKWHVDYLLLSGKFTPEAVIYAVTEDRLECRLAEAIGGAFVDGFGCTDCRCRSHLFYREEMPAAEIMQAFRSLGIVPVVVPLI